MNNLAEENIKKGLEELENLFRENTDFANAVSEMFAKEMKKQSIKDGLKVITLGIASYAHIIQKKKNELVSQEKCRNSLAFGLAVGAATGTGIALFAKEGIKHIKKKFKNKETKMD